MAVLCRLLLVLALSSAACASLPESPALSRGGPTLTIVHFNDLHEMVAGAAGHIGGVARVATVVKRERTRNSPVLVTLGGDFLSPSAIATARVDGEPLAGRQAVAVLNHLGVDWATFGNHEFDLREEQFRARMSEIRFGLVSSNVHDQNDQLFAPAVPSTVATVKAGGRDLRLGIIGITVDFTIQPYVRYRPFIAAAREQVRSFAGRTDAIIALTHQSLQSDVALAEALPEIDLVLGGHEHENIIVRRGSAFSTIVKADSNAKSAAIITMAFPAPGARPAVQARIEHLNASITPDPAMEAEVRRWTSTAFAAFARDGFNPERVVANLPEALDGRDATVRVRPGNLTDLMTAALQRVAAPVDLPIMNGGSIRIDDLLPAGPITEYDIIRLLPFGGDVLRAEITGALLIETLNAGAANVGTGGYLHPRGALQTDDEWRIHGEPIDPRRWYTIALPEYLLTGAEVRMPFLVSTSPGVRNITALGDIRQAVIAELKARYGGQPVFRLRPARSPRAVGTLLRAPAW